MKNFLFILTAIFTLFLVGCTNKNIAENEVEIIEIKPEDLITMDTLDQYMERTDVQYVDLRNFEAKFRSGYIQGFEMIPFFDYLDNRAFTRDNTYEFNSLQIIDENLLRSMFDEEKAIFLYADGCIRSNYLRDVLMYLGYERVYVLGGYFEYNGEYNVLGDGSYHIGSSEFMIHETEDGELYYVSLMFDMGRNITHIRFDIFDAQGVSYRSDSNYDEQLSILEDFIINEITTVFELNSNILDLESNYYSNIQGYTLGFNDHIKALITKIATK